MVKLPRLSPEAHLPEIIDAWLFQLGATKPSPRTLAAYRADVEGARYRDPINVDIEATNLRRLSQQPQQSERTPNPQNSPAPARLES
jgi:hypothetical protein